jgi:Na+-transporting methylmalonyl-CoA/oxaloacetate decarboxylase gamma subunit
LSGALKGEVIPPMSGWDAAAPTGDDYERRGRIVGWINAWWQSVSGTFAHGLQITIVGMALVFFTLGLIILALVLLTRLPGLRVKEQEPELETGRVAPVVPVTERLSTPAIVGDAELAQVAAIAVALVRGRRHARIRPRVQAVASRWKQYGRAHQLGL